MGDKNSFDEKDKTPFNKALLNFHYGLKLSEDGRKIFDMILFNKDGGLYEAFLKKQWDNPLILKSTSSNLEKKFRKVRFTNEGILGYTFY